MKRWAFTVSVVVAFWAMFVTEAGAAVFAPKVYTLANGLSLIVVPNPTAPVVSHMVWYKVGSSDEVQGKTGLAHYLEHLMFRGTKSIPAGQFDRLVSDVGGQSNAFTAYDYTSYFETVAADQLPMVMALEADRMQNLWITRETAEPELSVVMKERQQRTDNSPEGRFSEALRSSLFPPSSPYGRPIIGWMGDIQNLTVNDAMDFYHRHYAPNRAVVVISGDVVPEKVVALASALYGAIPARTHDERPHEKLLDRRDPIKIGEGMQLLYDAQFMHPLYVMTDERVKQPLAVMQVRLPLSAHSVERSAAFEVLAEILGGEGVGLFDRHFVLKGRIASAISVDYDSATRGEAVFGLSIIPRADQEPREALSVIMAEMHRWFKNGITAAAVDAAKHRMVRSAVFARDSLMMPGYAFGIAETTGKGVDSIERWPERIKAVQVQDINRALRDVVESKKTILGLLLPEKSSKDSLPQANVSRESETGLMPGGLSVDRGVR